MAELTVNKSYTLELSKEEAVYLKGILQNYYGNPDDEPTVEANIRHTIFIELEGVL